MAMFLPRIFYQKDEILHFEGDRGPKGHIYSFHSCVCEKEVTAYMQLGNNKNMFLKLIDGALSSQI